MTYEECIQFLTEQAMEIRDAASNEFVAHALIEKYFAKLGDDVAETFEKMDAEAQQLPESIADDGSIAVAKLVEGGTNVLEGIAHQLGLSEEVVMNHLVSLERDGRIYRSISGYWEPADEKLQSALARTSDGSEEA